MKNRKNTTRKSHDIAIDVTAADYRKELKAGVSVRDAVKPGRHLFKRSNRQIAPEAFEQRNTKIKVNMYLDADVVEFFKQRAADPNAAPYQTQINAALREYVEGRAAEPSNDLHILLKNKRFIQAIADRVRGAMTA